MTSFSNSVVTCKMHATKKSLKPIRPNIPTEELRDFVADEEKAPKTVLELPM
jgi:hypothetical protein